MPILRLAPRGRKSAPTVRINSFTFKGLGIAALAVVFLVAPLRPQSAPDSVSAIVAIVEQLTSQGDTAAALAELDRALRLHPREAELHFRRGMLLGRRASTSLRDAGLRAQAEQSLIRALRLAGNDPRYLLELGRVRLKMPFRRLEAERLFRRALQAARSRGDPLVTAEIETELGDMYRRRADIAENRRLLTGGAMRFNVNEALNDWRYVESFLAHQSTAIRDAGELDRRQAEDRFRRALAARPAHEPAAMGLLGLLYDEGRLEEYVVVARAFAAGAGSSARAQLLLGLGQLRTGREAPASAAFDSALAMMAPEERGVALDPTIIMRRSQAIEYQGLPPEDRREAERVYWSGEDPLRLTDYNEYRLEHLARVAYADLRFSSLELRLRGWQTDRGIIYIRYGPPPVAVSFPPATEDIGDAEQVGRITTVWWYPERRLRFVFYQTPGYNYARFAGEFMAYAEEARQVAPVRYDNVPVVSSLDTIAMQVARFRDSAGSATEVVAFARVPVARMLSGLDLTRSTLETGVFVHDRMERQVQERRRTESVTPSEERQFEARTFDVRLAAGEYRLRVEAREPGSGRAARGEMPVAVSRRAAGLDLSDVVLANRVAPRTDDPRGRRDFLIDPNPAMSFAPGEPVHLYWEVYGLSPDTAGIAEFGVSVAVRLEAIERRGMMARVVGGAMDAAGLSAEGDDRVVLSYDRERGMSGRDRVPEHLAIDLSGSPPGSYILELTVTDLRTGRSVTRARSFTVRRGNSS
jgi:GWxTD domain-containing protein